MYSLSIKFQRIFRSHVPVFSSRSFISIRHASTKVRDFRIAIVGSGPAGFYSAHHLLNKVSPKNDFKIHLDIYERLGAPYGLSRYGVAPDHPEVKNCEEYLDNLMKSNNNIEGSHTVRFVGNIEVGSDVTLEELDRAYHSVILSYGCTSADNRLNVPGTDLPGVISAREFVNWYNGHPDFHSKDTSFIPPDFSKIKNVSIIGNGNVALDVARILLADPKKHWSSTDICQEAYEALSNSSVRNVNIIARRGILESAFSNKEIRELFELSKSQNMKFIPIEEDLLNSLKNEKTLGRIEKRRIALLEKYSRQEYSEHALKSWSLKYLLSPGEFKVNTIDAKLLSNTVLVRNQLTHDNLTRRTTVKATNEKVTIPNELVILSIGYKGSPLNGFDSVGIRFDTNSNRIVNKDGRILLESANDGESSEYLFKKGWYTSGWIKNGPKGVIATTMMESFETSECVIEDLINGIHCNASEDIYTTINEKLRNHKLISWNGWEKINKEELNRGQVLGKSRDKICDRDELRAISFN
ncbi:Piso0_004967 [Millerozyma farinosa CBS 7064]|uniref:NADPH:adrenodoxin oxidoreductase, mitochondrial n=1 Tax=Pichia sorbitophila (strain ATCC MYA-4447 / BCRC 22081 / CBS 7064 / NBRC 10061 / NRRL Y-12695) TaxID=559304 RepID=G8Y3V9_PICSO|nr:Piso0_004967 [Millerozyma farinosa CBS 7064]